MPLQVDDVELLFAALSPLRLLPAIPQLAPVRGARHLLADNNQLGAYGFNEEIQGYRRFDTTQVQMTATKVFSQRARRRPVHRSSARPAGARCTTCPTRASSGSKAPGTYTSGNPIFTAARRPAGAPSRPSAFPTDSAWGYVIAGRLDYNNAIGAVNLSPRFSWAHDVSGISPGPGRQLPRRPQGADRRPRLQLPDQPGSGISPTPRTSGPGRYNLINDRDFVAANVKYSF